MFADISPACRRARVILPKSMATKLAGVNAVQMPFRVQIATLRVVSPNLACTMTPVTTAAKRQATARRCLLRALAPRHRANISMSMRQSATTAQHQNAKHMRNQQTMPLSRAQHTMRLHAHLKKQAQQRPRKWQMMHIKLSEATIPTQCRRGCASRSG